MKCAALLAGGGRGLRHGGQIPKQYQLLDGVPVFRRTLSAFVEHPAIGPVLAVIAGDAASLFAMAADGLDVRAVTGGASRSASVRAGLEALTEAAPDLVLVHDAARPFISADLISRLIAAAGKDHGAAPGLAPADALKRLQGESQASEDVPREALVQVQTPQVFPFRALLDAYRHLPADADLADDIAVARAAGLACTIIEGDADNFKITRSGDLQRGAALLRQQTAMTSVIASGFDVHRLVPGDAMMLCGVPVQEGLALQGHSDADVALHALTDALLGTLGAGDIGDHFPPGAAQWKDADSTRFLGKALDLLAARGAQLVHVDLTIIGERPKIGPHRAAMRARLGDLLGLPSEHVSLKATTTEGLGFLGRGEGLACLASASVLSPERHEP